MLPGLNLQEHRTKMKKNKNKKDKGNSQKKKYPARSNIKPHGNRMNLQQDMHNLGRLIRMRLDSPKPETNILWFRMSGRGYHYFVKETNEKIHASRLTSQNSKEASS